MSISAEDLPVGESITFPREIAEMGYEEKEDVVSFWTSGGSKEIRYRKGNDVELLREGYERAFQELMDESDIIAGLGSPDPDHMSQWCLRKGTGFAEDTISSSVPEFWDADDRWDEATVMISMPRSLKSVGEDIQQNEEYGDLQDEFPNLRLCLGAGDVMRDNVREWIEENYDVEARNAYFGTEPGAVAVEVEKDVYKPTNPNLILEILDENAEVGENGEISEEDVYTVHPFDELEPGEEVTGPLLITTPLREEMPLTRYRNNDTLKFRGTEQGPRGTFTGREDNVILGAGANIYPSEIDAVIDQEHKRVVSEENGFVNLNFYLGEEYIDPEELTKSLGEENTIFGAWQSTGSINVRTEEYNSVDELEKMLEEEYNLPTDEDGDIEILNDLKGKSLKGKKTAFDDSAVERSMRRSY